MNRLDIESCSEHFPAAFVFEVTDIDLLGVERDGSLATQLLQVIVVGIHSFNLQLAGFHIVRTIWLLISLVAYDLDEVVPAFAEEC